VELHSRYLVCQCAVIRGQRSSVSSQATFHTRMPGNYYTGRPSGGQFPLTPPDSGSGHSFRTIHCPPQEYAPQQGRQDGLYEYQNGYMPPVAPPAASMYSYAQHNFSCQSLPPIQSTFYDSAAAATLPPMRVNDASMTGAEYQRQLLQHEDAASVAREQTRQAATAAAAAAPKEEKAATGGVSAKLDYEMDRMTDFVTEAAQSIFQYQMHSHQAFRKWVHQVLSATRLPSATILLSLHYLSERLSKHPGSVQAGENQIYRLLAVALVLGSKFLDDNTFINRSWSDVTAIKVAELNLLEMKWLGLISYRLHIEPKFLQAWIDSWQKYDAEYVTKQAQLATRLSPLDTNVHRHPRHVDRYSPYPTPQTATAHAFDSATLSSRTMPYPTPFMSNDPWAASGADREYYGKASQQSRYNNYEPHHDEVAQGRYHGSSATGYEQTALSATGSRSASDDLLSQHQLSYAYPQSTHASYYQNGMSAYANAWDQQRSWNAHASAHHRYDCTCTSCVYQASYRPYGMASGYGAAQSVMG